MREALIDVTRLVGRFAKGRLPTGVDRVCVEYVRRYGGEARALVRWAGRDHVLARADSQALFAHLLAPVTGVSAYGLVARGIARGWAVPPPRGAVLFNTGHSGLEASSYRGLRERHGARPVFMVHDLIPITHPQYSRAGERGKHVARMRNVLTHGRAVVTNSQATLDALAAFARGSALAMPPARVTHLAPGMARIAPGPAPLAGPYFVMLGTIEPRKNHLLMLQVWERLFARPGGPAPRLVVIGQRGWECENVVALLEDNVAAGRALELSRCSDAELSTYLHHARALLFPSFVEGYGMPLVEALALGVPVLASELAVFREIALDIPEYSDANDGARWEALVRDYCAPESAARAAQVERLANFRPPTWETHFARVDALLGELGA